MRERDDQRRWATDRDNYGGHEPSRGGDRWHGDDGYGRTDDGYGRMHDADIGMESSGWHRDDEGFREPRFRDDGRMYGDRMRGPGGPRSDRYDASGGYSGDRYGRGGDAGDRYGTDRYYAGEYDRGDDRHPYGTDRMMRPDAMRHRDEFGGQGGQYRGPQHRMADGSYGGRSEFGRGRDGGMPGHGDARYGGYGSGPSPREGMLRSDARGKGPKNFTRSDERIREQVCELLEDSDVDASDIEVRVANGEVTLEGTVESRRDKREAEDIACEARGVKQCHNQLRVGAQQGVSTTSNGARGTRSERHGEARS